MKTEGHTGVDGDQRNESFHSFTSLLPSPLSILILCLRINLVP